ncbi:MAG: hypothetical protein ACLFNR_01975 [Candidatus Paceibacterota bacterium]
MVFSYNKKGKEAGLTLIELIVAVGLFGLLSVFVTGAFVNIISMQTQAESKQRIINDFRVALDLMGKEIAAGEGFPQADDGTDFLFFSSRVRPDMMRRVIQYKVEDGRILKGQQDTQGECNLQAIPVGGGDVQGIFPDECFLPFTSEDVHVDDLTFYVHNFEDDDYNRPIIVMTVSGSVDIQGAVDPEFQTSVSHTPRKSVSPDDRPPADTTSPDIEIEKVITDSEGTRSVSSGDDIETDGYEFDIEGIAWDDGGSGVERVRLEVYDESDNRYVNEYKDGFPEGTTDDQDWKFEDIELKRAGEKSRIKLTVWDYSGNDGTDKIDLTSQAPPLDPAPPSLSHSFTCDSDDPEVDYVKLIVSPDDSGGSFDKYVVYKDGSHFGEKDASSDGSVNFYDTEVENGESYEYTVYAVNTNWSPDVESDPASRTVSIEDDECGVPETSWIDSDLVCESTGPEIEVETRTNESWELSDPTYTFEILDDEDGVLEREDESAWSSDTTFSWTDDNDGSGLSNGSYSYKSRICLGGVCSDPQAPEDNEVTVPTNSIEIDDETCKPPPSDVMENDIQLKCNEDPDTGDPSISVGIPVDYTDVGSNRPFEEYQVQECSDENCDVDPSIIGSCPKGGDMYVRNCVVEHYPREDAEYYYRVRTRDSDDSGAVGDWSGTYKVEIDGDMCIPGEPDGINMEINTELICTEDEDNDYREVHVGINDDNADETTLYNVYRCDDSTSGSCDADPFDQCTWDERGDCAVHYGPDDGEVHYYGVQMCEMTETTCSNIEVFGDSEDPVSVSPNECLPETAEIESTHVSPDSDCDEPGTTEREVDLRAFSDQDGDSIYINIYRDGSLIEGNLDQGEIYPDSVETGESYEYEFEACNPLADIPCGDKVSRDEYIESNICDPEPPSYLSSSVTCNDVGEISELRLEAGGSDHHDGYEIERSSPSSPSFSCDYESGSYDGSQCTDDTGGVFPITDPVTYSYKARSYRTSDSLESSWLSRSFDLDPTEKCDSPYEIESNPSYLLVTVTGGGVGTVDSEAVELIVDSEGDFSEPVIFKEDDIEIDLRSAMDGVINEDDITIYLSHEESTYPYEDNPPRLSVEVPDEDYLGEMDSAEGADITVYGTSGGFEEKLDIVLIIEEDTGTSD